MTRKNRREKPAPQMAGDRSKRGSFLPLVQQLEDIEHGLGKESTLSGAAFRAAAIVRTMRRAGSLSQAELAHRLGVSQARISEIEAGMGSQGPTWDLMERIAKACGTTILIAPHDMEYALDAAEFPDTAHHWTVAEAMVPDGMTS